MNKLIRLSPTGIEYADYAWGFASGCGNNIEGKCKDGDFKCWAYSITQRFADRYPNGFNPTIYSEALLSPLYLKKPSRILCAFMGDLFWDCPEFDPWREVVLRGEDGRIFFEGSLLDRIMMTIEQCPQHTFLFLTKQPQNLPAWSPFPSNCQVGVTATNYQMFIDACGYLGALKHEGKIKTAFISIEPLLDWDSTDAGSFILNWLIIDGIDWVIIGALTGTKAELLKLCQRWNLDRNFNLPSLTVTYYGSNKWTLQPKIEWIQEIVQACDKAGIPVFLKNNLHSLLSRELDNKFLTADTPNLLFHKWGRNKHGIETQILRQDIPNMVG